MINVHKRFIIAKIKSLIRNFEEQYKMNSLDFLEKYNNGQYNEIIKKGMSLKEKNKSMKQLEEWEYRIKQYCNFANIDLAELEKDLSKRKFI